jgi:predicted dehydrogenase
MPVESRLTVAVVGLGYWGPNLLRVLSENVNTRVGWLCDLDEERLRRFGYRHPGASLTTSIEDVLRDEQVDAVVIATPVFTHHELATASLRAAKHTFVEKPLASTVALADELIALSHKQERILMCGHTFIYSPPVRAVKGLLDAGELGDIYFVSSSRVNLGLHRTTSRFSRTGLGRRRRPSGARVATRSCRASRTSPSSP